MIGNVTIIAIKANIISISRFKTTCSADKPKFLDTTKGVSNICISSAVRTKISEILGTIYAGISLS